MANCAADEVQCTVVCSQGVSLKRRHSARHLFGGVKTKKVLTGISLESSDTAKSSGLLHTHRLVDARGLEWNMAWRNCVCSRN